MMAAVAVPTVQELHPEPEELQLLYSVVGGYLVGVVGAWARCLGRSVTLFRAHDAALKYEGLVEGEEGGDSVVAEEPKRNLPLVD